jgi:CRP/FNR family transcriptional regulator, cyclic AMP receptor protein
MTASGLYMQPERENVPIGQEANNLLQGDAADTVFYNQTGKVRLTVVSKIGKEATLGEPEIKRRR